MTSGLTANLPFLLRSAFTSQFVPQVASQRLIHLSNVDLRARKGTQEKQKKKKVKVEVKKIDFYTALAMAKNKNKSLIAEKPLDDSKLPVSCDDVYEISTYQTKVYPLEEAIQSLKEINDPSVFNMPHAFITARIELNMQASKKTRILENFTRLVLIDHSFVEVENRKILAFCKDQAVQEAAMKAGASLVGSVDLIKKTQKGEIKLTEYHYILAHPDSVADIMPLRGLLRKKFPSVATNSIDPDIPNLVKRFINGIQYKAAGHEFEKQFGLIEVPFGKLSMPTNHLIDNFVQLLKDVDAVRPKRDGLFVTRCFLKCEPTNEVFKIDPFVFIESGMAGIEAVQDEPEEQEAPKASKKKDDDSDDEDDVKVAKKS